MSEVKSEAKRNTDMDELDIKSSDDTGPLPLVAVVGRPNVGKSTLVNRIIGRREAVVQDLPGVTRDRVTYDANWNGRAFTLVDTGGWDPAAKGFAARIAAQAEIGMEMADVVMFVVDATVGATDIDEAVASVLRRSKKPINPGRQQGRRRPRRDRLVDAVVARAGGAATGVGDARSRVW